jgi:hypothetical protein
VTSTSLLLRVSGFAYSTKAIDINLHLSEGTSRHMWKHLRDCRDRIVVEKHGLNKVLVVLRERYVKRGLRALRNIRICPGGFKIGGILLTTVLHLEFDYTADLIASIDVYIAVIVAR